MHNKYAEVHDDELLREFSALLMQEPITTAELLAIMGEVDARRLYAPAGHSSMFTFCVEKLRLSEDAAYKRIQVARAARRHPELLEAIAEGRIHLAGACLLAPHLTNANAEELILAATHRRKAETEEYLARRFGRPEVVATRIRAIAPSIPVSPLPILSGAAAAMSVPYAPSELAPGQVHLETTRVTEPQCEALPEPRVETPPPPPRQRFLLQCPISKETRELLQYAQALLSHAVPQKDMDQVLQRALKALIPQLEKQKFAVKKSAVADVGESRANWRTRLSGTKQRSPEKESRSRYVPAHVKRAVWKRDGGRCTFVNAHGLRCSAREFLEFDHIEPVARGGTASVDGMRLRCRAHNQYEAEQAFGAEFMAARREETRLFRRRTDALL